ncbi:MAG: peptidoglycan DD-metalloendopeptidase family protein [Mogibacterium sp.]|nr:peptidoglycan DD-metalloendopeptidase family protein [Mogibacterium sp.]
MTDKDIEITTVNNEAEDEETKPVEVYSEKAETEAPDLDSEQIKAAALAYAKYLREQGLIPGDATFVEPEEIGVDLEERAPEEEKPKTEEVKEASEEKDPKNPKEKKEQAPKKKAAKESRKKKQKVKEKKQNLYKKQFMKKTGRSPLASVTDGLDRMQDAVDGAFVNVGQDTVRGFHRMATGYMNSRRTIGFALLLIGILAAAILIIFDTFTVYEYAYNGKVLGYVQDQEEVTDVLDIAGRKLSSGRENGVNVEFVANQNVTFNLVEGKGKSTDDSDTVINKLIYMTDIETEATAIYDGDSVVAIVKDEADAEDLLAQTMGQLSIPDNGMVLVSSEFVNELNTRPINVLLGSVQSKAAAQEQMVNGGDMETFHIAEEGETVESIAGEFGVETDRIYDENNEEVVSEIEQGDKICIRSMVEPVSVKMVETGKIKETVEYQTIKKETDKYYKGDTYVEQEGVNGVQIFEGTITKVAGEETDRDEISTEVIKEKKDKIILVGTAERPKTAATGTFIIPLDRYTFTSGFGYRWGRLHKGVDLAVGTGNPIHAADGGKVVRASYYGGYGYCVEIEHEPGVVTRYAHCSQILVSVGDLVYQGQTIALVGNTGNSFGSHLHFEVLINGSPQNPVNYIHP